MRIGTRWAQHVALLTLGYLAISCSLPADLLDDRPCPCDEGWACNLSGVCVPGEREPFPPTVNTSCWINRTSCDWATPGAFELVPDDGTTLTSPSRAANFTFSPDGCSLYYARISPDSDLDLFFQRRSGPVARFDDERALDTINTLESSESAATVSPDARELLYSSNQSGVVDVYRSRREQATDTWPMGDGVSLLNQPGLNTFDVVMAPHGLRVYLSRRVGLALQDILVAERTSLESDFETPVVVGGVSLEEVTEAEPSVTADELVMVYTTQHADDAQLATYFATRPDWNARWTTRGRVPGAFFESGEETAATLSPNGCELLVVRDGSVHRLVFQAVP